MSNYHPIFFPAPPKSSPFQGDQHGTKGVMLCLVSPQPTCRLVYTCMGDHCGLWGYPAEGVWREWEDEDYKLPEKFAAEDRGTWWKPPCHVGDTLPAPEPWAFMKCSDCYACESPQSIYRGRRGCFIHPTPQSQTHFHPASTMPRVAARYHLLVERVQMMRLHKVPAAQYYQDGFISQDGYPFPADLRPIWTQALISPFSIQSCGWDANPFVWVVSFEKRKGKYPKKG